MSSVKELFENIKRLVNNELPNSNIYLIGESLRESLLGRKPTSFEFFIETKDLSKFEEILPRLSLYKNTKFLAGKKINSEKEIITINCLYVNINDILGSIDNVQSFNNGLRDYTKGVVKLTEKTKQNFDDHPHAIFSILETLDTTDFFIDPNTAYFLFNKRSVFFKIEKRRIFNFLKDTLKKNHPRKFISYLNTFGISKELFGVNLVESTVINHLRSNDMYELFSVIFDNIDLNSLELFLVEKCGFLLKDVEHVVTISKIIRNINDESDDQAILVLNQVNKSRIPNMCRLLKSMGYKNLAKKIRKKKNDIVPSNELCITESMIRISFGVDNAKEINQLMEIAKNKIKQDPEYNEKSKILIYLNSERNKLCLDQERSDSV